MPAQIARTVQLYVTQLKDVQDDGRAAIAQDQAAHWKALRGMAYRALPEGRIRQVQPEVGEAVRVTTLAAGKLSGWFYRTKFTDFPLVADERDNELPLELPDGKGLRFVTHFRWWDLGTTGIGGARARREGLLAAEFNLEGPRIGSLETYLQEVFGGRWRLDIRPLIRPDFFDELRRNPFVKLLRVRVPNANAPDLAQDGIDALDIASDVQGVEDLQLELKPARRQFLNVGRIIRRLKRIVESDASATVQVKREDGQVIDLAKARVARKVLVDRLPGGRAVDSDSMLAEIERAVREEHHAILRGLGHRPDGHGDGK